MEISNTYITRDSTIIQIVNSSNASSKTSNGRLTMIQI